MRGNMSGLLLSRCLCISSCCQLFETNNKWVLDFHFLLYIHANLGCFLNKIKRFPYNNLSFCLWPKAKDLGITRVVVVLVGFFVWSMPYHLPPTWNPPFLLPYCFFMFGQILLINKLPRNFRNCPIWSHCW